MKTNDFGRAGIKVSEIGFGGSRIGGLLGGKRSGAETITLLQSALGAGINFYDTADIYAQGESERLIGDAFRHCRSAVVLATKGGFSLPVQRKLLARIKPLVRPVVQALGLRRNKIVSSVAGVLAQDFSPAYLSQAVEGSLKRLRTDYIDIYQLHSPPPEVFGQQILVDALGRLEQLKTQGKIREFGIATENAVDADVFYKVAGISSLQVGFGLLDPHALNQGILSKASAQGLGVIARGSFAAGLLKDGPDAAQLKATTPKWERVLAIRAFGAKSGRSALETALKFNLATPGLSVTLLGMHTPQHLNDNLRAYRSPALTPSEYAYAREHLIYSTSG